MKALSVGMLILLGTAGVWAGPIEDAKKRLSDGDPNAQIQAAQELASIAQNDFGALNALQRLANDFGADGRVRVAAAAASIQLQPNDSNMTATLLKLAGEMRDTSQDGMVKEALRRQGDPAVSAIVRSYENKEISDWYARTYLMATGTVNGQREASRIALEIQGHESTRQSTTITHERAAPNVTEPGYKKHLVDR